MELIKQEIIQEEVDATCEYEFFEIEDIELVDKSIGQVRKSIGKFTKKQLRNKVKAVKAEIEVLTANKNLLNAQIKEIESFEESEK